MEKLKKNFSSTQEVVDYLSKHLFMDKFKRIFQFTDNEIIIWLKPRPVIPDEKKHHFYKIIQNDNTFLIKTDAHVFGSDTTYEISISRVSPSMSEAILWMGRNESVKAKIELTLISQSNKEQKEILIADV